MITREETHYLITNLDYPDPVMELASEIRANGENISWEPRVEAMIDKVIGHYKKPSKAVEFLARVLKITKAEFKQAHESYALRKIVLGAPYVCYDSFDTFKLLVDTWIGNALEAHGDCTPELMLLYLMPEREGPFKPFTWFKLKLLKKV